MTAADTVITDNSGAVAANNNVGGDLNQHVKIVQQYFREFVRKHLLDPDHVTELLRTYEPPPDRDQAADVLGRRHAVVLVGGEGTGRRTTAVQLLHERNVALHELDLESGRDLVEPPCEPRCGYLFAADVLDSAVVQDYATRLRAEDSYLVVWTTRDVTQEAGTFLAETGIHLHPHLTEGVFRRDVDVRLHPAGAAWWRACQDLEPLVKGARPADVARRPGCPVVIARLARTVAKLAVRQDDLSIVRWAVEEWSVDLAWRPFAAEVLGMAAVDPTSGRRIRQWMYGTSRNRRPRIHVSCFATTLTRPSLPRASGSSLRMAWRTAMVADRRLFAHTLGQVEDEVSCVHLIRDLDQVAEQWGSHRSVLLVSARSSPRVRSAGAALTGRAADRVGGWPTARASTTARSTRTSHRTWQSLG